MRAQAEWTRLACRGGMGSAHPLGHSLESLCAGEGARLVAQAAVMALGVEFCRVAAAGAVAAVIAPSKRDVNNEKKNHRN